jgi:hypothetical protein
MNKVSDTPTQQTWWHMLVIPVMLETIGRRFVDQARPGKNARPYLKNY